MFGDLDWPLNASRGFVSISWASLCIPWTSSIIAYAALGIWSQEAIGPGGPSTFGLCGPWCLARPHLSTFCPPKISFVIWNVVNILLDYLNKLHSNLNASMNFENIFVVISDFSQYVCQSVTLGHWGAYVSYRSQPRVGYGPTEWEAKMLWPQYIMVITPDPDYCWRAIYLR